MKKEKEKILLIGGGGHCKACIDVIETEGRFEILGIIDTKEKVGQDVLNYKIIGTDEDIEKFLQQTKNVLITVGQIKNNHLRKDLYNKIKLLGGVFPVIISPRAHVSGHSQIDEGTIIMHGAVVNVDSKIGKNCIINNLALVEHDVVVGDFTHISTGARVNGGCIVGNDNFIGSGTVLNQGVALGDNIIISSGALVRKNIDTSGIYAGNPLRQYK